MEFRDRNYAARRLVEKRRKLHNRLLVAPRFQQDGLTSALDGVQETLRAKGIDVKDSAYPFGEIYGSTWVFSAEEQTRG